VNQILRSGNWSKIGGISTEQIDRFLKAEPERTVFRALYLANRLSRQPELVSKVLELTDAVIEKAEEVALPRVRCGTIQTMIGMVAGRFFGAGLWTTVEWRFIARGGWPTPSGHCWTRSREYGPLPECDARSGIPGPMRETARGIE
jgi:hypothetical protein